LYIDPYFVGGHFIKNVFLILHKFIPQNLAKHLNLSHKEQAALRRLIIKLNL
ncbi:hypothetical protein JOE32_004924, partial [Pseudomonas sp. PvP025]|nr:hypothetical protein [Pseudomonas sp. PvP025]